MDNQTMQEGMLEAMSLAGRTLGPLLLERPDSPTCTAIIGALAELSSLDEWPFVDAETTAEAHLLIQKGLADGIDRPLIREYARLFEGPNPFAAPPWGSVYLDRDCVVFGDSTVELRRWLRANGVTVVYPEREPEDQIGRMLMLMAWLAENKPEALPEMLSQHLLTWSHHFFEQFIADIRHPFYRGVALLADATLQGICEVLALDVPVRHFYR